MHLICSSIIDSCTNKKIALKISELWHNFNYIPNSVFSYMPIQPLLQKYANSIKFTKTEMHPKSRRQHCDNFYWLPVRLCSEVVV